jgi:hypothetical protein
MIRIFVATYRTESGDDGVIGYWTEKPTEEQLTKVFKDYMPDEFEDDVRYVWWDVHEMALQALPEGIPTVPSL